MDGFSGYQMKNEIKIIVRYYAVMWINKRKTLQ